MVITEDDVERMKTPELKDKLLSLGLSVCGSRTDLTSRLITALNGEFKTCLSPNGVRVTAYFKPSYYSKTLHREKFISPGGGGVYDKQYKIINADAFALIIHGREETQW